MTEAQSIANDLKADGQTMTLTRTTIGEYDPVVGEMPEPVTQTWTVYGITGNFKRDMNTANEPNSLVLGGDRKATVSAMAETSPGVWIPVNYLPGDTLTIMGADWTIIAFDELSPQGEVLFYTCQIRK